MNFLLFSLYFTHCFAHYLKINLADKIYLLLYWVTNSPIHSGWGISVLLHTLLNLFGRSRPTLPYHDKRTQGKWHFATFANFMFNMANDVLNSSQYVTQFTQKCHLESFCHGRAVASRVAVHVWYKTKYLSFFLSSVYFITDDDWWDMIDGIFNLLKAFKAHSQYMTTTFYISWT